MYCLVVSEPRWETNLESRCGFGKKKKIGTLNVFCLVTVSCIRDPKRISSIIAAIGMCYHSLTYK